MSATQSAPGAAGATTTEAGVGLLDQVIGATKQTERDRAQELIKALTEEALKGTVTFSRNLTMTFDRAITALDAKISEQLNAVIHHERFLKLEGSWRGLHYLVQNSETGTGLKIRLLQASKRELSRDLQRATEFDQSQLFKKIYENEFGTPGGEPYGSLIGDYEWSNHPDDIETLRLISNVAAASFAPFISATGAGMFGFDSWNELSKPRDLAKIFESTEYAKWRGFRDTEDSRFVNLVMPRVLARLPYGAATKSVEEFGYEEAPYDAAGKPKPMGHDDYCWMNAAYVMGARLTNAFAQYGFCVAIRGAEGGGKVENLPTHIHLRRRRQRRQVPDRDRHHRPARGGALQPGLPAALPLQEHRLRRVLRRAVDAEGEEVRQPRRHRQRGDLGPPAVPHGDQPLRPLPEGDGARQDRLLHGGDGLRGVAQPLDQGLRELERQRGRRDQGQVPAARRPRRGARGAGQARRLQRRRLHAALAADGGTHHLHAHGRAHPAEGLSRGGTPRAGDARCPACGPTSSPAGSSAPARGWRGRGKPRPSSANPRPPWRCAAGTATRPWRAS
jgi:hypothetical protein